LTAAAAAGFVAGADAFLPPAGSLEASAASVPDRRALLESKAFLFEANTLVHIRECFSNASERNLRPQDPHWTRSP
jgi:hypothetical protein